MTDLILASASPARLALLRAAGFDPKVIVSGVDESTITGTPERVCHDLAMLKARAVAVDHTESIVVGCDSILDFEGEVFGKPRDADDVRARWRRMRGRTGVLRTGQCVILGDRELAEMASTTVYFADISDAEIESYIETGEPLRVAGAFTIDGIGSLYVDRLEGDHGTVIGLSLPLLRRQFIELGVDPRVQRAVESR